VATTLEAPKHVEAPARGAIQFAEFLALSVQFALVLIILQRFHLMERAMVIVGGMALVGFLVHCWLPMAWRLRLFCALSLSSVVVVFGALGAAWLIGFGFCLLGLCHVPIPWLGRVSLVLAAVAGLLLLRGDLVTLPWASDSWRAQYGWSAAIWPVLGSMFMLRLIVYLYDLRYETKSASWWTRIAYFFLLPNAVCVLFPLIDYKTFQRTYYDDPDERRIYQVGLVWMFRGCTHLAIYRLIYQNLVIDASQVVDITTLIQFLVVPVLLYLRVSGEFHMIAGMLHMFGFNLPETHHLFFFSSSFTDFWRRTNIYWKDFMQKVFYYPAYFQLRAWGPTRAVVAATCWVFFVTWFLHAWQWFWIRGELLLNWNDTLFWTILAALVVANSLYELKFPKPRTLQAVRLNWSDHARKALCTVGTFTTICLLWSFWSSESIEEWLSVWSVLGQVSLLDVGPLVGLVAGAVVLGMASVWAARKEGAPRPAFWPSTAVSFAGLLVMVAISIDRVASELTPTASGLVRSLRLEALRKRDYAMLQKGYYENLAAVHAHNFELAKLYRARPQDWVPFVQDVRLTRPVAGIPYYELIPSVEVRTQGVTFHTNRWGMRDQDYEATPPPNTKRMVVMGASLPMGAGVEDVDVFEAQLERRLNQLRSDDGSPRWEILNFAVAAYTLLEQPSVLENRALKFRPNVLLYVAHSDEKRRLVRHLIEAANRGVAIPFDKLHEVLRRAKIGRQDGGSSGVRRVMAYGDELVDWCNRRLVETCRAHDIVPFWVHIPLPIEVDTSELSLLKRMAAQAGFVTFDLGDVYTGYDQEKLRVSSWDIHPNALGHRLIAERLYTVLRGNRAFRNLQTTKAIEASVTLRSPRSPTELPRGVQ